MSQPLLRVVLLFGFGVALGQVLEPGLIWLLAGAGVLVVLAYAARSTRRVCLALLLVVAGWMNLNLRNAVLSERDLRLLVPEEPVLASVRGDIVGAPRFISSNYRDQIHTNLLGRLRVSAVNIEGCWQPAHGVISVRSRGFPGTGVHAGSDVELTGVLERPRGPLAEGLFDYRAYLKQRGIEFQLRTEGDADWKLVNPQGSQGPPLAERFIGWARQILARGLPAEDPAVGLIQAMTLGWKTSLTDEIEEPFMKSGTMHIFAISGLHIALVAGILISLLRVSRVPRNACGAVVIPLLWFYTMATGWQASAVRAALMMTIILGGWTLKRPSNLLNSLAAAALIILVFDPRQLFQVSFQFSFSVVLAMGMILPPVQEHLLKRLRHDPLLPPQLVPRWKRWLGTPVRWILFSVATSFAAWIGSLLLTAHYFHLFSPCTLLANVLVIPCAGAALASALTSLACGAWWPWLSEVFNNGAWFWMHTMMAISERVSALPGAYRYAASPPGAAFVFYFTLLFTIALGWFRFRRVRAVLITVLAALAVVTGWQILARSRAETITVLPLRGGIGVCCETRATPTPLLVDCGNTNVFDSILAPFLKARGVNHTGALVLTHGDSRHVGAALALNEEFPIQMAAWSPVRFRSTRYRAIVEALSSEAAETRRISAHDQLGVWTVLYPSGDLSVQRADDGVLVLRGIIQGTSVLLMSDLSRSGQRALLAEIPQSELRSDIVVVGLPQEDKPLIDDLLHVVQPHLIIIADSERPASRRASEELLTRLSQHSVRVLSTRSLGALRISFVQNRFEIFDAAGERVAAKEADIYVQGR